MKCGVPEFARCCFCLPLRFGLLVWAYMKLAIVGFLLLFAKIMPNGNFAKLELQLLVITIVFTIFFCVDIIFHIILIVSAHTKDYRKMNWFYREALFGLGLYIFGLFYSMIYMFSKYDIYEIYLRSAIWCFFFWLIVTQAYLIILVRSEAMKLKRSSNNDFRNNKPSDEKTKIDTIDAVA